MQALASLAPLLLAWSSGKRGRGERNGIGDSDGIGFAGGSMPGRGRRGHDRLGRSRPVELFALVCLYMAKFVR